MLLLNLTTFGQTEISGTITSDTTLLAAQSPWILDGNLYIKGNASLTIAEGATIDLKNYRIYIGYGTPAKLVANGAFISSSSPSEKSIVIRDGGCSEVSNCMFDHVFMEIESDAGDTLRFTSNSFENVSLPFDASPLKLPNIQGESSSIESIGISGYIDESCTLPLRNYSYTLSANLFIRNHALLNIEDHVQIDIAGHTLFVGNSTPGGLEAHNVSFFSHTTSDKRVEFHDGGFGNIQNCLFDNVFVKINSDASDSITLNTNQFSQVNHPVDLSISRSPSLSGIVCDNNCIGLFGSLEQDKTLPRYEQDYKLTSSIYIKNNATLSFGEGISIDFDRYTFSVGNTSSGTIEARNVHFFSGSSSERSLIVKDNSTGNIEQCSFDRVNIKIEEDAGNELMIQNNRFENTAFPILLSVSRSPVIHGNISENPYIGLFGSTRENNTLPKYDWNYQLSVNIYVEDEATLTLTDSTCIGMNQKRLQLGTSSSDHCSLHASNVHFIGSENNRGEIYFYKNSGGTLVNCRFEQTYIRINGGTPSFTNSRFYHSKTAVEIMEGSTPVFTNNDFYNNEEALINEGTTPVTVPDNYWGHPSGPQHENNPEGAGEIIEGNVSYSPVREQPVTGSISGSFSPQVFQFGR
nr:NosD domain-containing protein [Prolixibacteraceae bacterium]